MKGMIVNEFKCFHSAKGYKMIGGGNHNVKLKFGYRKMLSTNDIFIFHFWTRSIEQYEKKIVNTFKVIENGLKDGVLSNDFGFHIRHHYDLYQQGKTNEVYEGIVNADGDNYVIDNRLYDFIKNGYKNAEQILATKYFINNNFVNSKTKYKLDKFILSCKRRWKELRG